MFAGPLPPEVGRLGRLTELHVQNNTELSGPVPETLTSLDLDEFIAGGTGLCTPDEPPFRAWLESILKRRVQRCGSGGTAEAYLTQAVQSRGYPVPLVAGESALLRTFISSEQQTTAKIPPVRATFFVQGVEMHVVNVPAGASAIPTEVREGELNLSANTEIPAEVIQPGLEMVIEIDPDGTLDPGLGVARRIPESGRVAVDVRAMPTLELTLIPFIWTGDNDLAARALVEEIHPDHEILWQANNLLPVGAFEITKHRPVTIDFNDATAVLIEVGRIRTMEAGTGHWKGLLPNPDGSQGVAWIGGKASVSNLTESTIAHELGHNFNLRHADCGNAAGPDPTFPWPNAAIGALGVRSARRRLARAPRLGRPHELLSAGVDQRLLLYELAPLPDTGRRCARPGARGREAVSARLRFRGGGWDATARPCFCHRRAAGHAPLRRPVRAHGPARGRERAVFPQLRPAGDRAWRR